jgi:membrane protein
VTFYAAVGLIPMWLLALFLAGQLMGPAMVQDLADGLTGLLPDELGARDAARFLSSAGTSMSPLAALAALVPASLYGEGLVRAFDRFSERPSRRRSARGRIGSLVVVALSPGLLLGGLSAAQALTQGARRQHLDRLLGVYFAFLVGWFTISPVLAFAYRGLTLERPGRRALLWGAAGTGSFLSGTCLGSCCSCRSASTSAGRTAAPPTSPPLPPASVAVRAARHRPGRLRHDARARRAGRPSRWPRRSSGWG